MKFQRKDIAVRAQVGLLVHRLYARGHVLHVAPQDRLQQSPAAEPRAQQDGARRSQV